MTLFSYLSTAAVGEQNRQEKQQLNWALSTAGAVSASLTCLVVFCLSCIADAFACMMFMSVSSSSPSWLLAGLMLVNELN